MYRLLLFWAPSLARQWVWIVAGVGLAVATWLVLRLSLVALPVAALAGAALPFYRWWAQLIRFGWGTRRFRTLAGKGVCLYYAPGLPDTAELLAYRNCCERVLADFTKQFGFPLRRRLVVYLFATPADLSRLFQSPLGGAALCRGDAILLSVQGMATTTLEELVRHELAHLFSSYWGTVDPPLKGEGLATWLMGSIGGQPIDFQALAILMSDACPLLPQLLPNGCFHRVSHSSYTAAGSFTGFLIHRFGWEAYRTFFSRCREQNYPAVFAETFGASLLTVERQWRDELFARRPTYEPELTRLVGEQRVMAAYQAGHLHRCLEESEALCRAGQASPMVLWYAATAHAYLGHYQASADLLQQALESEDAWVRSYAGPGWFQLGNLWDLLSRREDALPAYRRVLAEPDAWTSERSSLHAEAHRYLRQPFTEHDLLSKLLSPRQGKRRGR